RTSSSRASRRATRAGAARGCAGSATSAAAATTTRPSAGRRASGGPAATRATTTDGARAPRDRRGRSQGKQPPPSVLRARDELARARVDLDALADLDELRDLELVTGLGLRLLRHVRRRVAADRGLALLDRQRDRRGELEADRLLVEKRDLDLGVLR